MAIMLAIIFFFGGILMIGNSIQCIRGNPVRSSIGLIVALVLAAIGALIFLHRVGVQQAIQRIVGG